MRIRLAGALSLFLLTAPVTLRSQVTGPMIQFQTTQGNINVTLNPSVSPLNVANFLAYVNSGEYNNSIIHRLVAGFVFQGGGYQLVNGIPSAIATNAAVVNEYSVPNTAGTLAMALAGGNPNSATSQWFFNLADNSATLDNTTDGGPFTVIGTIPSTDAASLAVMTNIGALTTFDLSTLLNDSAFTNVPLINYSALTADPVAGDYIVVNAIVQISGTSTVPTIGAGGVITASGFGAFPAAAQGSFVEIYGSNLAGDTRGWRVSDFVNLIAPTTLDGVGVTVGGYPAYVNYVSPGQVNIQVPANVPSGGSVPVIVTYNGQSSASAMLAINPVEGGLLAPATFKVGSTQYVTALHLDNSFVGNGAIPNITSTPASPGETLVFYGVGFGGVTPTFPIAGEIVSGSTSLTTPVTFTFGTLPAVTPSYQGLSPNEVGVYQFNVTVPADAPSGDLPLQVTQAGTVIPQTLFISVN